jgi:hypothetical protein
MRVSKLLPQFWAERHPDLKVERVDSVEDEANHLKPLVCEDWLSLEHEGFGVRRHRKQYFLFHVGLPQEEIMSAQFQHLMRTAVSNSKDPIAIGYWGPRGYAIAVRGDKMEDFADLCHDALTHKPSLSVDNTALVGRLAEAPAQTKGHNAP